VPQLGLAAAALGSAHAALKTTIAAGGTLGARETSMVLQFLGSVVDIKTAAPLVVVPSFSSSGAAVEGRGAGSVAGPEAARDVDDAELQCSTKQFVAVFTPYYHILESMGRCYQPAVVTCLAAYLAVLRVLMVGFMTVDRQISNSTADRGGGGGGGGRTKRRSEATATTAVALGTNTAANDAIVDMARCAFFDRNLHSRMPLVPTPARLKRAGV
jgi:hypothetical protein